MGVVIGIVAGFFLLSILEARHQGIAATAKLTVGSTPIPPEVAPPPQEVPQVLVGATAVDYAGDAAMSGISIASGALKSISSAIPIIGAAVDAVIGPLLAAHRQRMQDATTENRRVAAAVPSFYQTLVKIVNLYNARQISRDEAVHYMDQLNSDTEASLKQFVGSPGTAWNNPGNLPGICNKQCTVGCCIYSTYLSRSIRGPKGVASMLDGSSPWDVGFGPGVTRVAGIPTNKYGFPGYPQFPIKLAHP